MFELNNNETSAHEAKEQTDQEVCEQSCAQEPDNLQRCNQELEQAKDRLRYLLADFENFKRRTEKERLLWIDKAHADVLLDVINIVDDFDRALSHKTEEKSTAAYDALRQGVELIHKALHKLLAKYKVEEMSNDIEFDPERHEAIMQTASDKHASGQIVAVLQKGFTHKGVVLRPAKVTVAE